MNKLVFVIKLIYSKLNKKRYFLYVFLDLASTLVSLLCVSLLGTIVNEAFSSYKIPIMNTILYIFIKITLVIVFAYLNKLNNDIDSEAGFVLEKYCLNRMYSTSYLNVAGQNSAEINQKINADCNNITQLILFQSIDLVKNILTLLVCELLIGMIQIKCMLFVSGFIIANTAVYSLMKNKISNKEKQLQDKNIELFSKFHLAISKMKSIRNGGLKNRVFKDIDKYYDSFFKARKLLVRYENIYSGIKEMLSLTFQIGLLILGVYCLKGGRMSIAQWIVISTYFTYVSQSSLQILEAGESYLKLGISINRIWEYLDEPLIESGDIDHVSCNLIECRDVEFRYRDEILRKIHINCSFEKDKIYWVKGANGTGKSTMVNLLSGLYGNDYDGVIAFDGYNQNKLKLENVIPNNILIVEQFPFVYANDIYEFIGSRDESSIIDEFEKYNLDKSDIESKMLKGTIDRELSGGEKQKLEIIRAMLSKKKILIFDEITASIDEQSKKIFYNELVRKKANRIIILISHEHPLVYDAVVEM